MDSHMKNCWLENPFLVVNGCENLWNGDLETILITKKKASENRFLGGYQHFGSFGNQIIRLTNKNTAVKR